MLASHQDPSRRACHQAASFQAVACPSPLSQCWDLNVSAFLGARCWRPRWPLTDLSAFFDSCCLRLRCFSLCLTCFFLSTCWRRLLAFRRPCALRLCELLELDELEDVPALAHEKMPKETLQRGGVNYLEFLSDPALQLDRPNTRCHCRSAHIRQLWICCLGPRVQQSGDRTSGLSATF